MRLIRHNQIGIKWEPSAAAWIEKDEQAKLTHQRVPASNGHERLPFVEKNLLEVSRATRRPSI